RTPQGAQNSGYGYYNTTLGSDYPFDLNENNFSSSSPGAGSISGGLAPGNLRIAVSFDVAVTPSILIGIKAGVALFHSPSVQSFLLAGAPVGLLFEGRFTYLFGGVTAPAGGVRLGFNGGKMGLMLGVRPVIAVGNAFTFSIEPEIGFHVGF